MESNLKKKCTLSLIIIHFVTGQGFHNRCKMQQNKSEHRQLLWVVNNRTLQIVGKLIKNPQLTDLVSIRKNTHSTEREYLHLTAVWIQNKI